MIPVVGGFLTKRKVKKLRKMSTEYLIKKEYDKAEKCLIKLSEIEKGNYDNYQQLGLIQKEMRKIKEAKESIQKALSIDPENYGLIMVMAELEADPIQKRGWLQKAVNTDDPDRYNALEELAKLETDSNKKMDYYREILKMRPDKDELWAKIGDIYQQQGKEKEAEIAFKKTSNPDAQKKLRDIYLKKKEFDKAINYYKDTVFNNPQDVDAWQHMVKISKEKGDYSDAIEFAQTAVEKNPDNPLVYLNLALILEEVGKREDALKAIRTAESMGCINQDCMIKLGRAYLPYDADKAKRILLESVSKITGNPKRVLGLAKALTRVHENEQALKLVKILEGKELNSDQYVQKGEVLLDSNKLMDAITAFETASKMNPYDTKAMYKLALTNLSIGKKEVVENQLKKIIAIQPTFVPALMSLGKILVGDDPQKAIFEYEKVISVDPEFTRVYYEMSLAYDKLGLYDKAMNLIQKGLEQDPNNIQYLQLKKKLEMKKTGEIEVLKHKAVESPQQKFLAEQFYPDMVAMSLIQGNATSKKEEYVQEIISRSPVPVGYISFDGQMQGSVIYRGGSENLNELMTRVNELIAEGVNTIVFNVFYRVIFRNDVSSITNFVSQAIKKCREHNIGIIFLMDTGGAIKEDFVYSLEPYFNTIVEFVIKEQEGELKNYYRVKKNTLRDTSTVLREYLD